MPRRQLACPNRCLPERFEALNAPLYVDASGGYLGHDAAAATYVCATCGAVALDMAAVARAMDEERLLRPAVLSCPGCGTEMLPPEDDPLAALMECPVCGVRFSLEEGTRRLHGGDDGDSGG